MHPERSAGCPDPAFAPGLTRDKTAELFVPTMRALYHVVSKPSEESWPEQALPYAIAFKPPADWSLHEQTRAIALPDAEPQ